MQTCNAGSCADVVSVSVHSMIGSQADLAPYNIVDGGGAKYNSTALTKDFRCMYRM